jgi:glycine/D-amino acid oxidase-like deaminating enzyme
MPIALAFPPPAPMPNKSNVAIVGGGPAGLSLAKLLQDARLANVTVFEGDERLGGKSFTVRHSGATHEMGTCYSTFAHRLTNRWMRDMGMRQSPLGQQMVDGVPLMQFVKSGPGQPLAIEGLRFVSLWLRHQEAVRKLPDHRQVRDEAGMTIAEWLDRHKLVRIRRFMLRALTNMGYGFLDEVTTLQALRWCTPDLILSGALGQVKMPLDGWQPFWERLAQGLNVRAGDPVSGIERRNQGVVLTAKSGEHRFDSVVVTVAPDDAAKIMRLSADESAAADALDWGRYVTTLCEVDDWFDAHEAEAYSETLQPGAERGQMMSARRLPKAKAATAAPSANKIYLSGQYGGHLTGAQLEQRLAKDIGARGAKLRNVILQKQWKYFPRYRPEAVRQGLVSRMNALQGHGGVWWSGAAFSHEAVSNIVSFNQNLVRRMTPALERAPR